ncbi:MAG: 5-3 exonuclease, N-terminal resolvase-like domain protein [Solirubrobacterales bacterium]|nr:5-3 exonuclease, N-terminal resolvase-like domain protein [Solirubrobacterales bacterium]
MPPLLAVDGPSLIYRAFFALPDSIKGADGTPVNALLGSTNALLRMIADRGVRAVVVCWGAEAAHYRVEAFPPYHADRPPVPDGLAPQLAAAPDFYAGFGWESADAGELEADDLLHSYAVAEEEAGGRALIVTGDRDLFQCASVNTTVLYLKTGVKGFEEMGPEDVRRRYGVPPELVPDFIALRGDPSDSLPGAKGIGEKTAADLLRRYGSLEEAIAKALRESPRVRAALHEQGEQLAMFKDIATLRRIPVSTLNDRATDLAGGAAAARRQGMGRLAERLEKASSVADL